MSVLNLIKTKKNIIAYKKKRDKSIIILKEEFEKNKGENKIFSDNEDINNQIKEYVKTRNIEMLVNMRIDSYKMNNKSNLKYPPLLEAIVNFIFIDFSLLNLQGDKDHSFEDSVDNMIFILQ